MFGYACDETTELMPLPIMTAHQLSKRSPRSARRGRIDFLRPDGKTQVSVRYERRSPVGIDAIVVSTQHGEDVEYKTLKEAIIEEVIKPIVPSKLSRTRPSSTSTRPAASSSAARRATPASPAARSSSTPTAAWAATAAARSRARIRRRSIARPLLRALHREERRRGGPRAPLRGAVRLRDRRRRAGVAARRHVRHRHGVDEDRLTAGRARDVRLPPGHADQGAQPAAAHLPEDRRLRPLRPRGRRLHWERTDKAEALKAAVRKPQSAGAGAVSNGTATARTAARSRRRQDQAPRRSRRARGLAAAACVHL